MKRDKDAEPYAVGYRRPPVQHRFAKGKSGNPAGRPRKVPHGDDLAGAQGIVDQELCRKLKLTEGGKPVTLDVFTAVFRAATVSALKGSPVAQKTVIQAGLALSEAKTRKREAELSNATKLKLELENRRDAWVASGRAEDDMPVHPSDIEIYLEKGEAKSFMAITDEERATRRRLVELRDHFEAILTRSARTVEEEGDDLLLEIGREAARRTLLEIDKKLPARLRSTRARP